MDRELSVDGVDIDTEPPTFVEGWWVHVAETLCSNGESDIRVTREDGMPLHVAIGMLQSALKYYEALRTNLFFANDCPHCTWEVTTDDGEDGE